MALKRALSHVRAWVQMRGAIGSGSVLPFLLGLPSLRTRRFATARRMSDPTASRPVALEIWWDFPLINGSGSLVGPSSFSHYGASPSGWGRV
jgi:hypothetical protein